MCTCLRGGGHVLWAGGGRGGQRWKCAVRCVMCGAWCVHSAVHALLPANWRSSAGGGLVALLAGTSWYRGTGPGAFPGCSGRRAAKAHSELPPTCGAWMHKQPFMHSHIPLPSPARPACRPALPRPALAQKALTIKSAIPHPRIMGVIRECGGKMHMQQRVWAEAATDFFEVGGLAGFFPPGLEQCHAAGGCMLAWGHCGVQVRLGPHGAVPVCASCLLLEGTPASGLPETASRAACCPKHPAAAQPTAQQTPRLQPRTCAWVYASTPLHGTFSLTPRTDAHTRKYTHATPLPPPPPKHAQAFKSYDEAGSVRRVQCLKYLVLANMLMESAVDPFDSQEARPYKNDPEVGRAGRAGGRAGGRGDSRRSCRLWVRMRRGAAVGAQAAGRGVRRWSWGRCGGRMQRCMRRMLGPGLLQPACLQAAGADASKPGKLGPPPAVSATALRRALCTLCPPSRQVSAMTALVEAFQQNNIREFEKILKSNRRAAPSAPEQQLNRSFAQGRQSPS